MMEGKPNPALLDSKAQMASTKQAILSLLLLVLSYFCTSNSPYILCKEQSPCEPHSDSKWGMEMLKERENTPEMVRE